MIIPNIWEKKTVPNHQPDIDTYMQLKTDLYVDINTCRLYTDSPQTDRGEVMY